MGVLKYGGSLAFAALLLGLGGCSSPEADGKKAADKALDCLGAYAAEMTRAYERFDPSSFETRVEAREKMAAAAQKAESECIRCRADAAAYRDKLNEKYLSSASKAEKFQYAYAAQSQAAAPAAIDAEAFQAKVNARIQTIIPPKPGLEKLKNDLVGRRITEGLDGYRGAHWYWAISSPGELKTVEIKNAENKGDDYLLDLHLVLQGENTDYEADVQICYVLRQHDDWTIDTIETKNMQIVQTHRYDTFITIAQSTFYGFNVTNSSDVPLLVGGALLESENSKWKKFTTLVRANSTERLYCQDCKIHFIERP